MVLAFASPFGFRVDRRRNSESARSVLKFEDQNPRRPYYFGVDLSAPEITSAFPKPFFRGLSRQSFMVIL